MLRNLDGEKYCFPILPLAFENLIFLPSREHIIEGVVLEAEQLLIDNCTASESSLGSSGPRYTMKEISILHTSSVSHILIY